MSNDKLYFLMNWAILSDVLRPFLATKIQDSRIKKLSTGLIEWSEVNVLPNVSNKTRLTMNITERKVPHNVQLFADFSPMVPNSIVSCFNLTRF